MLLCKIFLSKSRRKSKLRALTVRIRHRGAQYRESFMIVQSFPQAISTLTEFPQLDGPVLTPARAKLAIGTEAQAPNRPVMALPHVQRVFGPICIQIPQFRPRILVPARHELALSFVHSDRGDFLRESHGFDELTRNSAGKEICSLACRNGEGRHRRIELAGADGTFEGVRSYRFTSSDIEPADLLVFAGSCKNVWVPAPYYGFDCRLVHTWANLEAGSVGGTAAICFEDWRGRGG